jgi:D-alanyl-lipoteichoic acid acyltransferase DltB (MBOAT superfamily)
MPPVVILVCLVIALSLLQRANPRLGSHPLTFLGFNLLFLALVMQAQATAWLALFLAFNYTLAAIARRRPDVPSPAFVLPAVVCFVILKRYDILPLPTLYAHIPEILGLSYIVFRSLTIIIEARDARTLPGVVSYLNFCLGSLL